VKARVPIIAVGSNGSKIERLISHSLPSLSNALIPVAKFSEDVFLGKLNKLKSNPGNFVVKDSERDTCIKDAMRTVNIVQDFEKKWRIRASTTYLSHLSP
jgi:hypothetical protein